MDSPTGHYELLKLAGSELLARPLAEGAGTHFGI